jgi:hypothetical protein
LARLSRHALPQGNPRLACGMTVNHTCVIPANAGMTVLGHLHLYPN